MSWTYVQSTGVMLDAQGKALAIGYSGADQCKNISADQNVHGLGPLPVGSYTIHPPVDTMTHGPYVLWLTPDPLNEMFGRSGFGIHGDSIVNPGTASEGCIIMPRFARERISESGDNTLKVVAED
jgi:hypothetical protein